MSLDDNAERRDQVGNLLGHAKETSMRKTRIELGLPQMNSAVSPSVSHTAVP